MNSEKNDLKDLLFAESAARAEHTVWIMSDLQQDNLELTRKCLELTVADYHRLGVRPEQIWYLGDATQDWRNLDEQVAMTRAQGEILEPLDIPVCFVMGNHDMDYAMKIPVVPPVLPMWEEIHRHPTWHTTATPSDFYFQLPLGAEWMVYFFSDHIASDRSWGARHGLVKQMGEVPYPYDEAFYDGLRARMAGETRRIITASHYGFAGCNRPSNLLSKLMPLPPQVKMHFYGHAHITDLDVCYESAYKRMGWLDWHDIPAFDVASMENVRCAYCRTVFLHLYADGSAGIFWRNHDAGRFEECFFTSPDNLPEGLSAYRSTHPDYLWYRP